MGIIAVVLSAFRYREQYILWMATDVVAVAMYVVMFDPVYLTKKSIYLIMAIVGIMNWWRLNRERNADNE
jgi:nicotinamide mononucleotide transporter